VLTYKYSNKMSKNSLGMCRICLEGDSDVNIFRTLALNDLVANLLIDCADVEVNDFKAADQIFTTY
jgi:hypothetical protein